MTMGTLTWIDRVIIHGSIHPSGLFACTAAPSLHVYKIGIDICCVIIKIRTQLSVSISAAFIV